MKIDRVAVVFLFVSGACVLLAQTPAPAKELASPASSGPLIVDVHSSPYRATIDYRTNISKQRFDMRNATVLDMIEFAYNLGEMDDDRENSAIVGGPTWIDFDRFDVIAKIPSLKPAIFNAGGANSANPPENPNDLIRPVLKRVLAERFHLKFHTEVRPLPGYIATVAKGGTKLAVAKDPAAASNCHGEQDKADPGQFSVTCTSETMGKFLLSFGGAFPHPIIDHTGLTKSYDFTLKITSGQQIRTRDDIARIYTDALSRIGIVVTPGDVPQPAVVIDTVDRTPAPNPPEIAKLISPLPDLEFEVASIRPSAEDERGESIRPTGSQITFSGMQLSELIVRAWQLPTALMLGDTLALLPKTRFTILVKLPPGVDGRTIYQDQDEIDNMLQKLLIDRFEIKYHWGKWTQPNASVLFAGSPKMKKADPNSRSYCKYGPPEGERDIRSYPNSPYDHEFHCQNVTMAQFSDLVQPLAGSEVKNRVPNETGLAGSYDFTLYYTSGHKFRIDSAAVAQAAKQAGDGVTAPVAGEDVQQAFQKQLGLKLELKPLSVPGLVLDHFDQVPTAN